MTLERETKLRAPATFELPELSDVPGVVAAAAEPRRFTTVYVDTPDLRLARWGCSLRHREGDGWTLKLPRTSVGATVVRDELAFGGEARRVPAEASDLISGYARGADVRPVVRLRTLRRRIELADEHGSPVGEVVDDEVSVMDGPRVAARFREIEVEAATPESDPRLEGVVSRLVVAGASPTDGTPKYQQALGGRASAPPDVVAPELGPDASVGEVVRGAIATSVVRLLHHDAGVRMGGDLEDVHQARVATRRLRSDLRTFRDVLDPEWDAGLREELGWLGAELGTVRDLDVQLERLAGLVARLPDEDRTVGERLVSERARRRDEARAHLLGAMRSERYLALLDRLVEDAREPAVLPDAAPAPAEMMLATVMERPWKHLKAAMDGLGPGSPDTDLHLARIRTKRVRYAAEAVAPVFGKGARAFAREAAALQEVLGEHQDAVVGAAWLRAAAQGGARRAFVAGQLATLERQAAAAARARWPDAWKRLTRKRLRFWP
ncbi:MAG TPA: CYTH and CHAD domain-containing protein [Actinomycetota bacterium]|nr:CYTH and CHAD domain-containing protein [Actinomycetota bacterium]